MDDALEHLATSLRERLVAEAGAGDPDVSARLSSEELEGMFDEAYHFKHVDTIFERVFGEA
mgnify:CR=1 FL=1